MGKINLFTLLSAIVVQFVVGYLWYGTHLFGSIMTAGGGHGIDFLKLDVISLLLVIFSTYGLTYILDTLLTKIKDVGSALKTGLTVGTFAVGLPITMLLSLMGTSNIVLLVVFTHIVLVTMLTSIVIVKLR
jgi:hypothetical protein